MALRCYTSYRTIIKASDFKISNLIFKQKNTSFIVTSFHNQRELSTKPGVKLKDDAFANGDHKNNKTISSGGKPLDEQYSLFHQPSHKCIPVKMTEEGASVFLKEREHIIDLTLKPQYRGEPNNKAIERCADDTVRHSSTDPDAKVHSIDELVWKRLRPASVGELPGLYAKLAKSKLTSFIVLTSMAGYAMAPAAFDPVTFLLVSVGTTLTCASANAVNQIFEVPFDSQMNRTKNRPIVRGYLTPLHASVFAGVTGVGGVILLACGVNGLAAGLGALNLLLYTCAYTPMKRISISNTWVGGIVGAIPPAMGWVACTGSMEPGCWLMALILFAWQFPHFNALSWNLRQDYSRAGYRMMSVVQPELCRRTALTYSVIIAAACAAAPLVGLTTWTFAADSAPLNVYLVWLSWRFYRGADSSSSRRLFMYTLAHLPALLLLMIISKKPWKEIEEKEAAAKLKGGATLVPSSVTQAA